MGDRQDGARVLGEVLLQPLHALGIEMVGRLVEEQEIWLLEQQPTQRHAAPLTPDRWVTGSSPGGQRSASIACSIRLSSSHPLACSIFSMRFPCSVSRASKSASGSPIATDTSSNRAIVARRSATASSTFSRTVFVSSSDGSCSKSPTEYPGDSCASPFDGWSSPGHDPKNCRLASTIGSDYTDLGAWQERQGDIVQDQFVADSLTDLAHRVDELSHFRSSLR